MRVPAKRASAAGDDDESVGPGVGVPVPEREVWERGRAKELFERFDIAAVGRSVRVRAVVLACRHAQERARVAHEVEDANISTGTTSPSGGSPTRGELPASTDSRGVGVRDVVVSSAAAGESQAAAERRRSEPSR